MSSTMCSGTGIRSAGAKRPDPRVAAALPNELRWLADENFNNDILRALFRRNHVLDIVRVQDVGLSGVDDNDPAGVGCGSKPGGVDSRRLHYHGIRLRP